MDFRAKPGVSSSLLSRPRSNTRIIKFDIEASGENGKEFEENSNSVAHLDVEISYRIVSTMTAQPEMR